MYVNKFIRTLLDNKELYLTQVMVINCPNGMKSLFISAPSDRIVGMSITNTDEEEFACNICKELFEDHGELELHNTERHPQTEQNRSEKLIECATRNDRETEGKESSPCQTDALPDKFVVCPVCSKDCKRPDVLARHLKQRHPTGKHVYHCRGCSFSCNEMGKLQTHEATHIIQERFLCQYCQMPFRRRAHMMRHVRSQHLKQWFVCEKCRQPYTRKEHLSKHIKTIHESRLGAANPKPRTMNTKIEEPLCLIKDKRV